MSRVSKPRARRGHDNPSRLTASWLFGRRAVALLAAAALLNLLGPARAAHARTTAPAGQVTAAAGLVLDGSPAVSGQTFFSGSAFSAAEDSTSVLALGNLARVELSGGTTLRLDFTAESLGGTLGAGGARVYSPPSVAATLATADASVLSDVSAGPALFSVLVSREGTTLSVQAGRVEMRAGGRSRTAVAGESLRAARGSAPEPPQGNNLSGKKKAGIFIGIAAALTAVILVLTGQDDDEDGDVFGQPCPILISPSGPLPPGC